MLKKEMLKEDIQKLTDGNFCISKVAYRINGEGELSTKVLSKKIRNEEDHPYFNFDKNKKAMLRSGWQNSFQEAVRTFRAVHEVIIRTLNEDEYLWAKDSLAGDQETALYLSFTFQPDEVSRIESKARDKAPTPETLCEKIESVSSLFEADLSEKLGIIGVEASKNQLQVKFSLDYQEPEAINFEKVKVAHYSLLSFLYYEEDSSNKLSEHILSFLEKLELPEEDKDYPERLMKGRFTIPEDKGPRKEVIERLKYFYQDLRNKPYHLKGYEEMEISTQILIFDAIRMGISYETLDEADHVLRLTAAGKTEYVQQATRTGLVSYISSIIMENKYISKRLLEENNFSVPKAAVYAQIADVMGDYWRYKGREIVVKPKTTNKGIGISIFKPVKDKEGFEKAIERAFSEDSTVLIEEFIAGTEYRFFVLDGKCRDVLYRKPANVKGDGKQTIEELVDEKNTDVNRGYDGRAPLEVIQMGEVEKMTLTQQGFELSSIPKKDEVVYLRENSNISTGGDSISFLEKMDDTYLEVAEDITKVLEADVCGVDLIVPDYQTPSTEENPGYHFLEANANPGLYGHMFVVEGKGVRLTMHVLDSLFPSLNILDGDIEVEV